MQLVETQVLVAPSPQGPLGVKQMPANGCPPFRGGGGHLKVDMILTPTTPFSQRAEPSPLWFGTFPKRRMGRGITRISRVPCDKAMRGCASRVSPFARRDSAPYEKGHWWRERPPFFRRWCGTGQVKGGQAFGHPLPLPRGGRSLHSDPCGKAKRPLQSVSSSKPCSSAESWNP